MDYMLTVLSGDNHLVILDPYLSLLLRLNLDVLGVAVMKNYLMLLMLNLLLVRLGCWLLSVWLLLRLQINHMCYSRLLVLCLSLNDNLRLLYARLRCQLNLLGWSLCCHLRLHFDRL